ncbi:hypothetical protein BH23PAT2_BH23PAT2_05250 [soil metagenome]
MIIDNRENFTSIEISRPVVDGTKKFLDKIARMGDQIFGNDVSTLIQDGDIDDEGFQKMIGVGSARLRLYQSGQLRFLMFERRATPQMHLQGSFRNALSKLEAQADPFFEHSNPVQGYQDETDRGLEATLRRIGYSHDIPQQGDITIKCDGLAIKTDGILDPRNGSELALLPAVDDKVTTMFVEQTGLCVRALAHHGRKSVYPMSPEFLHIPFGRLPRETEDVERSHFIQGVKALLPLTVTLGGINTQITHQYGRDTDE